MRARPSFGALAALGLALFGCGAQQASASGPAPTQGSGAAPDFELATLSGGRERLSDHRGKDVVLIDFWATFCEPCLLAMPELDALYRRDSARGFVVFGVSIDEAASAARVRGEASKLGVSFPILLDQDTRVVAMYNPRATAPYSVLVGRDGTILRRQEGYTTGERENLERAVDAALAR
ncbi:MAG TPA: TlpA disulfide reductase family protein [Polyangiaceae bacterium]|nr:TlpA disulfide reductase family protein [Polyangiaceae bacterium]